MTDQEVLLRSILESPDDDAPRLILADWLEEHGEPERAEFIRVQIEKALCANATHPRHGEGRYRARLTSRAGALWKRHKRLWLPWDPAELCVTSQRGFAARVTCGTSWFLRNAKALFCAEPVTSVSLRDRRPFYRGREYVWHWAGTDDRLRNAECLPPPLWDRL